MNSEIDLIREGNIDGKEALERLYITGRYVFHGSPRIITTFKPQQAHQFNYQTGESLPDGEPAVFAATEYEPAIFRALINNEITPNAKGLWSGWNIQNGAHHYHATLEGVDGARKEGVKAYVYVFNKSDFEPFRGIEYRSLKEVKPVLVVDVTGKDLPNNIEIVEPAD